jgi:hypothetical protein
VDINTAADVRAALPATHLALFGVKEHAV